MITKKWLMKLMAALCFIDQTAPASLCYPLGITPGSDGSFLFSVNSPFHQCLLCISLYSFATGALCEVPSAIFAVGHKNI